MDQILCEGKRNSEGFVRISNALRGAGRAAAATGRGRLQGSRLHPLRERLVSLLHPANRRTARQRLVHPQKSRQGLRAEGGKSPRGDPEGLFPFLSVGQLRRAFRLRRGFACRKKGCQGDWQPEAVDKEGSTAFFVEFGIKQFRRKVFICSG